MRTSILGIAIAFLLAPCVALAQSKIEYEYKPQKPDGTLSSGGSTGRATHKDISVTKKVDKSSPLLMNKPVGGSTGPTKPPLPTAGRRQ
jgi:hypothetical protein